MKENKMIFILISIIFMGTAQILFKYALNKIGPLPLTDLSLTFITIFSNKIILLGFLLGISSSFFWLIALSKMDLSFVYPFMGLGYMLVVIISAWLFKENINIYRGLGVGIVFFGTVLLARDKK